MPWAFRISTNLRAGGGHAARCASLAHALGEPVTVFTDPEEAVAPLALDWAGDVVREGGIERLDKAVAWFCGDRDRRLVIDSYNLEESGIAKAVRAGHVAMFRDALPYGPEQISINVNPGATAEGGVIAGLQFMPLPPRFADLHGKTRVKRSTGVEKQRVLVAFGLRDSADHTVMVVRELLSADISCLIVAAVGAEYENADALRALAQEHEVFEVWQGIDDLPSRYAGFDLAVGGPGVSQSERACCGLPTVLVSQNTIHDPLVRAWQDIGAAVVCDAVGNNISKSIRKLLAETDKLGALRNACLECVDGRGAERLASALQQQVETIAVS